MNKLKTAVYIIPILVFMFLLASCKNPTPSATWVVSTLAGSTEGFNNGSGTAAQFNYPIGVAVDSSGNVYVADWGNHRVRKIEYRMP